MSDFFNEVLRAAANKGRVGEGESMDDAIRRQARGEAPPAASPPPASGPDPLETAADKLRAALDSGDAGAIDAARTDYVRADVARQQGIPPNHVHRLQGSTREELERDAPELRSLVTGEPTPEPPGPSVPTPTSFDGGPRPPGPEPPVSMGSILQASLEEARERRYERAAQIDRERAW